MDLTDTYVTVTAEGVPLETTLAGLGSRATALFIDTAIQYSVLLALVFLMQVIQAAGVFTTPSNNATEPSTVSGVLIFVIVVSLFVIPIGYFIAFEAWNSGRTPGKQLVGIRVIRLERNFGFVSSAVRNLFRLIDELPIFYLIGIISVLATKKNQRLGDLVAGTIVIRYRIGGFDRRGSQSISVPWLAQPSPYPQPASPPFGPMTTESVAWDTSAITVDEISTVQRFLERRMSLDPGARMHLATALAGGLTAKVGGNTHYIRQMPPEMFLEQLLIAKTSRR